MADSNRFNAAGAASSLAVVSVTAALAGRPALLGSYGRTLLVTDFSSQQLQSADVASLP